MGLAGECRVIWSNGDCPVAVGSELFLLDKDNHYKPHKVAALRRQGRFSVVRFDGTDDRASAQGLSSRIVYIPEDLLEPLPRGEYYSYQILGLGVFLEDGRRIGEVVRIFTAGENDVYEVLPDGAPKGREILIPAISSVVIDIDLAAHRMTVRPMEGMMEGANLGSSLD